MTTASPVPLYHRIASMLASRINTGVYPPRSLLGTEVELAEVFGVSRITIRRALETLADEGLIERHRSRGTFVSGDVQPQAVMQLNGNLDDILLQTTTVGTVDSRKRKVVAPPNVAKALHLAPGTEVYRFERLRMTLGDSPVPMSRLVNHLPLDVGRNISRADVLTETITSLIDRQAETRIAWGQQLMRADLADEELARLLQVDVGFPILLIERTLYAGDGRPLDLVRISYRADHYTYSVRLDRLGNLSGRSLTPPKRDRWVEPAASRAARAAASRTANGARAAAAPGKRTP